MDLRLSFQEQHPNHTTQPDKETTPLPFQTTQFFICRQLYGDAYSLGCYVVTSKGEIKAAHLFLLKVRLALIISKEDNETTLQEI